MTTAPGSVFGYFRSQLNNMKLKNVSRLHRDKSLDHRRRRQACRPIDQLQSPNENYLGLYKVGIESGPSDLKMIE